MKKYLFILAFFGFFKTKAQDLHDSLSKYSYLVQTNEKGLKSQATGFFVRHQNRLFFITAAHCLTGWDPFRFKQIENFPDTVFIRLSNDTSHLKYLPLPISGIKKTAKRFREYESPDVYVVEIKEAKKYRVFSVEQFFDAKLQCDLARTVFVSGYPNADGYNDYFRDRQQPFTLADTLGEAYCIYAFRPEVKLYDAVNYFTHFKDGTTGPGLSGAPAYLLTEDKTIVFGGIYIGGDASAIRTGMIVRPEYVLSKILAKIINE
ncbi:MAG: hypothetical protein M3Y85_04335 [Bacteroidota bacterium]|nr:hypothetical protein [Bacteroidota bacterium]